jgi:hypothetical protein
VLFLGIMVENPHNYIRQALTSLICQGFFLNTKTMDLHILWMIMFHNSHCIGPKALKISYKTYETQSNAFMIALIP